ncbi:hypothetical protein VC1_43 [Vibrio phage Vc1]|uniref:Uncharacterized protein n=1 Tax=Vibrio phage Vc1 TaxID=1480731 RepID=A0A9X9SEE9_9CAUD|nr:hypothetical protein KMB90_gp43 [Vibrio virus 2019VC1]
MKSVYRVIAISRATGKIVSCYTGDRASTATSTYEDLLNRKMFMEDFKVKLQRLEPVDVMESE